MMYHGLWGPGAWGMGALGWIGMALVWALIILGIVWLLRQIVPRQDAGRHDDHDRHDSALELLRQRFARGEIDTEEFEERHERLRRTE
jgi:putative membrane protein